MAEAQHAPGYQGGAAAADKGKAGGWRRSAPCMGAASSLGGLAAGNLVVLHAT